MILHSVFRLFILVNKLIVKGLNSAYREPLRSLVFSSFYIQPTVNDSYQLEFTAYDDKSVAFNLLTVEASVIWDGQEFVIKQLVPDYSGGVTTVQVTAIHVGYCLDRVFQHSVKSGEKTYTVNDVLEFILGSNELGYTWQVIGNFEKAQITDLGNCNGKDMLSKIVEAWPKAIFWPDNKNIRIFHHDSLAKNLGNRIDYLNSSKEIKLTYDSNEVVNKLRCVSVEKDSDDSKGSKYWFEPFYVTDDDSIKRFGVHDGGDVSDDRYHDVSAMTTYGKSKLVPEPSLAIEVTNNDNVEPNIEEIVRLEIRPFGYVTTVEVMSYQYYPLDKSQPTQITLNNRAKTILNYQRASQSAFQSALKAQQAVLKTAKDEAAAALSHRLSGTKVATSDSTAVPIFQLSVADDNDDFGLRAGDAFAVKTTVAGVDGLDEKIAGAQIKYGAATPNSDGLMTAADRVKLDGLQNYANATPTNSGLMSAVDKDKLDKIKLEPVDTIQMKDATTGSIYYLKIIDGKINLTAEV
ncbi:phage tail protein [Lactiplantibacillus plantarum]|uniref:phage tail protein n=1 Tax=Lactiplantibacillus plantarum TaxID=1590 RepID=UPI0009B44633